MISFIVSIIALIVGYAIYGKFVEKVFAPDAQAITPAERLADGVDYVKLDSKKTFLIQFLNIAGTGPIFGAIAGAMWGPAAFIWIVFGCIFAGAVHDYLVGMMSLRKDGASVGELVGDNLGDVARHIMRIFSVVLLILVGVVFIKSPAAILYNMIKGADGSSLISEGIFVVIIISYYLLATVLPVDKVIGKLYPVFGISLLLMALGIGFGLIYGNITGTYHIPEIAFKNFHPAHKSIFPYLCISIACGAISGFHATQSPMMARCLSNETEGRKVFYGAMISEGIVALVWAAAAMSFYKGGLPELGGILSDKTQGASVVVSQISSTVLGKVGGILAILGVVACPITSGDTAFRSARLTIADALNFKQGPIKNRFIIAIPLFVIGAILCKVPFGIIWQYFSWSNQTLATIALWAAAKWLANNGKKYMIALVPAMFMTVVVVSYILMAKEGFVRFFSGVDVRTIETIANITGIVVSAISGIVFMMSIKNKDKLEK